jgi:hypothetical protein
MQIKKTWVRDKFSKTLQTFPLVVVSLPKPIASSKLGLTATVSELSLFGQHTQALRTNGIKRKHRRVLFAFPTYCTMALSGVNPTSKIHF